MISVIVPLYNEGTRVRELVAHLQGLPGLYQIILVDASDEVTSQREIGLLQPGVGDLRNFQVLYGSQRGRAAQMNHGARHATGSTLLFLHCDTRLPRSASGLIHGCMRRGCVWGRFGIRLDAAGWRYRIVERMINIRSRVRHLATGDQAMFVSRKVFEQLGGFAPIPLMEDVEISGRLKHLGPPALITDAVSTSARRWQQKGVLRTVGLMWKLRFLYWTGHSPERLSAMYDDVR